MVEQAVQAVQGAPLGPCLLSPPGLSLRSHIVHCINGAHGPHGTWPSDGVSARILGQIRE